MNKSNINGSLVQVPFKATLSQDKEGNIEFPKLNDQNYESLEIDVGEIVRINSMNILKWIQWLEALKAGDLGSRFILINVRPALVRINAVLKNFLSEGSTIRSFFVPYVCDHCGNFEEVKFQLSEKEKEQHKKTKDLSNLLKTKACAKCNFPMELDAQISHYQLLLNH